MNERRPSYRRAATARALGMLVLFTIAGCGDSLTGPDFADSRVGDFVDLMNAHRVNIGCPALVWHGPTAEVAQAHSADMIARSFFAHTNPDGDSPFDRLNDAGVDYSMAAENIAYGYGDATSVLQAWLDSPGHKANIENCALLEHGVGLVDTHWTHLFITTP